MNSIRYESPRVHIDIFALIKLYKGSNSQASEVNESLKDKFKGGEIFKDGEIFKVLEELAAIESVAVDILGAGVSFAIYKALKEFLSLEGARRRGEIKNCEVIEQVGKITWEAGKKGVVISALLGIIGMFFGGPILIPLSVISPFVGVQMVLSLSCAFWQGLDDIQKQELKKMANRL